MIAMDHVRSAVRSVTEDPYAPPLTRVHSGGVFLNPEALMYHTGKGVVKALKVQEHVSNNYPQLVNKLNAHHLVAPFTMAAADVNHAEPGTGKTALMYGAKNGNIPLVDHLMAHGANVHQRDNQGATVGLGDTALHHAAQNGDLAMVKHLVEKHGAVVSGAGYMGNTPLIDAARHGHTHVVDYLLGKGANVDETNNVGQTAVMHTAMQHNEEMVRHLVEVHGANINFNASGHTALSYALRSRFNNRGMGSSIVDYLIDQGATR